MKSSIKTKPTGWDALVVLLVVFAAIACAVSFWSASTGGALTAILSVDGKETEQIPLAELQPQERAISANGYTLRLSLTAEAVWMEAADCPTQDCVHTGKISRSGQSIVCLPARVSVQLKGDTANGVDAVLG